MKISRNNPSLILGSSMMLLAAVASFGRTPVEPVNTDRKGLAIKGYDPVAYFKQGAPVQGSPQFTREWMGATWRFASAEDRDLFAANPEQYAPRYGGYCAYAVSEGHTANIDPDAWKIVGGRLYLNYSKGVQTTWEKDIDGRIERANKNWPALHK